MMNTDKAIEPTRAGFEGRSEMKRNARLFVGILIGCAAGVVLGQLGLFLFRKFWPAYLAVDPLKLYTTAMLLSRLTVGALSAACAGYVTTLIAADNGKAAWWLGWFYFLFSLPIHLFFLWNDFPIWYHIVYLAYLVPLTGLAGRAGRKPSLTSSVGASEG
jgi:hypothetical protein